MKKKKIFVQNQGSTTKKAKILKVEISLKLVRDSSLRDAYRSELKKLKNSL